MNRKQRRKQSKKDNQKLFSLVDIQKAISIAANMKKASKGHLYYKVLVKNDTGVKNVCVFCGAGMRTKKQCDYWVMTLIDRVQSILVNPSFYQGHDDRALWLQHGEEYQNIRLPYIEPEKVKK